MKDQDSNKSLTSPYQAGYFVAHDSTRESLLTYWDAYLNKYVFRGPPQLQQVPPPKRVTSAISLPFQFGGYLFSSILSSLSSKYR